MTDVVCGTARHKLRAMIITLFRFTSNQWHYTVFSVYLSPCYLMETHVEDTEQLHNFTLTSSLINELTATVLKQLKMFILCL